MERRISNRSPTKLTIESLRKVKKKKKKEKRAGYKYIKVLVPPRFQDFRSRRENGGVITVNERIKGDELEEGKREKSEKQREKHESRNDTRTHRGRKEEEEEGEARRERGEKRKESAKRKSKRERERNCVSTRLLFVVYSQLPFIPHLFPTLNIHIALERAIIHNGLYRTFL